MLQKHEVYVLIIVASIALLSIAFFLILFVVYFLRRKREVLLEKEILERNFAQTLLQSQLEIQEQTLRNVSRELHDNLGHQASLIKINLTTLVLANPQKATEKIEDTKDLTRQLIADLKALSVSLGSDRINRIGLERALETEVARLNKTGQFTATFTTEGDLPPLNDDKAIILYRMAQEVLNNMMKHSNAQNIDVVLGFADNHVELTLRDNGVGFDVKERMDSGGSGLRNLYNRAQLINAVLNMQSAAGSGTFVGIRMPSQ